MRNEPTTPTPADTHERLLAAVERLERRLDRIERAVEMAEQGPKIFATVADTLDGMVERAGEAGIDVEERLRILAAVAERLTSPPALASVREVLGHVDVLHELLTSGVLADAPVAVVARAALSLAETCAEPAAPMGTWAALRALGDPDVQRALGFAIRFAARFGGALGSTDKPCLPAAALPS